MSSDKHQLVAFWAPFLLLHLGRQDTITAYALEDNELWLRHLLNMFLQVAGIGYVFYKYILAYRAISVSAAVYVWLIGILKYGERIWALKCASKGSSGRYWPVTLHRDNAIICFTRNTKFRTYAYIVLAAHELRNELVKPLPTHRNEYVASVERNIFRFELTRHGYEDGHVLTWEKVYRAIEVELGLKYDLLYTKAEVIHTLYGYFIRGFYIVFYIDALLSFRRIPRDRYCTPDFVITWVLLGGACALEVISTFKVIGSTWANVNLRGFGSNWLPDALLFARYHLLLVEDGRWSNSVGQYDFISFCVSNNNSLKMIWIRVFGLEDWWNKSHYTKHAKLSPALKEFIVSLLDGRKSDMVKIEDVAIRSGYWARRLTGFNQSQELDWSLRLEFHNCVFIWHIATNTFLSNPDVKSELVDMGMAEAVNTLSDYMMYLLVQHPDILPVNATARNLFEQTYASFREEWNGHSKKHTENGTLDVPHQIILDYAKSSVARDFHIRDLFQDLTDDGWDAYPGEAVLVKASILVRTMLDMELELTHKLVIIGSVWTEMLCYAATNASSDFHARQLSNGGRVSYTHAAPP